MVHVGAVASPGWSSEKQRQTEGLGELGTGCLCLAWACGRPPRVHRHLLAPMARRLDGGGEGQGCESSFPDTQDLSRGLVAGRGPSAWKDLPPMWGSGLPPGACLDVWSGGETGGHSEARAACGSRRPARGREDTGRCGGLGRGGFGRKSKVTEISRLVSFRPGACRWEAVDTSTSSCMRPAGGSISTRCCSHVCPGVASGSQGAWRRLVLPVRLLLFMSTSCTER